MSDSLAKKMTLLGAMYNFGGAVGFVTPGFMELLGVALPHSPMWVWLPALTLTYNSIILYMCAQNIQKYAPMIYWNAVIRCVFALVAISGDFAATAGELMGMVPYGDVAIGVATLWSIQSSTRLTTYQLLSHDYIYSEKRY